MADRNRARASLRMLAATFIPHFSTSLFQNAVGPLAPFLQEAFSISRTQIGVLSSVQYFSWTAMAMPAGTLVDRLGIRPWIFIGPAVFALCAFLFANITTFTQGAVIYLIAGLAFAFVNPATTKAIVTVFPQERRGTAIGIKQTGYPAGALLVSLTLPAIALWASWEVSMIFVAIVSIIGGICGWILYVERDDRLVAAETSPPQRDGLKTDLGELFHNTDFLLTSGLQGAFNMSQAVIMSYLVLFLVESMRYSTVYAGVVLGVVQLSGISGRILWGVISDLLFAGKRVPVLQIIGFVTVGGLAGLGLVNEATPAWVIWVVASAAGAGSFGFGGTVLLLRAELAGKRLIATSTGMGGAIASWGMLLGSPLFGYIVDTTQSYRIAWELLAILSLAATLLLRFIHEHGAESRVIYKETHSFPEDHR